MPTPPKAPPSEVLATRGGPRFAFVVHALSWLHRGIMGVPACRPDMVLQWCDGTGEDDVLRVCRFEMDGIEGVVVGVPMTPEALLSDQERALDRMARAVSLAGDVDAVGLGSLCAVVAGRGEALAEKVDMPVTNGGAATAWALVENVRAVARHLPPAQKIAVIGSRSPVGQAVAEMLVQDGHPVQVDHPRAARSIEATACSSPEEAAAGCSLIVGAGPTGGTLPVDAVADGAVLVDVAIPGTLVGRPERGITVLAGEAVSLPEGWRRGFWGWLYHLLSGYGPAQVFACLIEPLVLASLGRTTPFSIGRSLDVADVSAFGEHARELGFTPRLAQGWKGFDPAQLGFSNGSAQIPPLT